MGSYTRHHRLIGELSQRALRTRGGRDMRLDRPHHAFFFQAEDGIRAFHVTGVQTCALPIWSLAVCNVQGSMMTREADCTVYTHAGPEIGVASTKAFTSQMVAAYIFALFLAQERGTLDEDKLKWHVSRLSELPVKIEKLLNNPEIDYEELSKKFVLSTDFLYLGRGINFPIALEGALKLKEISYIHAEGYAAG